MAKPLRWKRCELALNVPPKPSDAVEVADRWDHFPDEMLKDLTKALDDLTNCLEADENHSNRQPKIKDGTEWEWRAFMYGVVIPLKLSEQVKLMKSVHPQLPFNEDIFREVATATNPFNLQKFVKAITEWKNGLHDAANWVELLRRK